MEWWRWKWGLGGKDFEGIHICSVYVKLGKWRWWIFFSRNYKLYTNNRQYDSNTLLNRSTGSAGLTPVVVWGIDLYAIRYLRTSSFHCLPSACAICILFKRDRFAFPLLHSLGAIMAWSSCVLYHSLPNTFQTHLKQTADHYHWLLIVVNHESWRSSPDSQWSSRMSWSA